MPADPTQTWTQITAELRQAVPANMYDIWLAPLRPVELDGDELVVEAPRELRPWVAERFARVLQTSAAAVLGPGATIHVRAGASGARLPTRRDPGPAGSDPGEAEDGPPRNERLNPKYTFEQFVIGDANRLAHAAALTVAELPGQAYNPLFVYGPPGVGKTHLLHAIGNYVGAYGSGLQVRATTAETFTNAFLAALRGGKDRDAALRRFKQRYRATDVLLIDDVQFLAAKARTMEEFFHTFNALYETGAQIVVTSDRTPDRLDEVDERLQARFQAGLVTAIAPPDRATRLAVLRKRAQHDGVALDDEKALERVADRVPGNVRALEGALIRVVAFSSLAGRTIDADLADEVLDDLYPRRAPRPGTGAPARAPTVERVQEAVTAAFEITHEELLSHSRAARLVWPRQLAMYLAREHTGATLPAIAERFGGRNHTTVLHACRRAAARLQDDPEARGHAQRVLETLLVDRRD